MLVRVPCTQVEALAQHAPDRRLPPLHTLCSLQPAAFISMCPSQVEALAQRALDRRLSRLDTSIYRGAVDPSKKPVRPC